MLGIMNGMVMQRNSDNVSEIYVLSVRAVNTAAYKGKTEGEIKVEKVSQDKYRLSGIPSGGPYTVEVDGEIFTDIYVGDVWILGGQSNMQGEGYLEENDKIAHDEDIRALFMTDFWGAAKEPLHEMWIAKDKVHTHFFPIHPPKGEVMKGAGPGISFAREMKSLTGVPQGLLCCAHGGASLDHWSEKLKDDGPDASLYAAMLRRFKANGANVKGMIWYQGCADAFNCTGDTFLERMKSFVNAFHKDFGNIPIVQAQLSCVAHPLLPGLRENWMKIREIQRLMPRKIKNLYTIPTMTKSLDDLIHLSRKSQIEMGVQFARTMYWAIYGTDDNGISPCLEIGNITYEINQVVEKVDITVSVENVVGELQSEGKPSGFYLTRNVYEPDEDYVYDIRLEGNKIKVRAWLDESDMENMYIYYGYGLNPYCNIKDSSGRELPFFGPIKVKNH